jgi:hypothetical protein
MSQQSRPAAACGAVFAVVLFLAAGDGSYAPAREVVATLALVLAIPFLCYVGQVLRRDGSAALADAAVTAGVAGIVLKIASGAPDVALHEAHLHKGTATYDAFTQLAGAFTLTALFPLAVFCAATAIVVLRSGAMPAWLGIGAALTAAALGVNGAVVGATFVPAMILFMLWSLAASIHLVRAGSARRSGVVQPALR